MPSSQGGKGNKKKGRNAAWCLAYKLRNQREKNKVRRLMRYVGRHGHTDLVGLEALRKLQPFWPPGCAAVVRAAEDRRRAALLP